MVARVLLQAAGFGLAIIVAVGCAAPVANGPSGQIPIDTILAVTEKSISEPKFVLTSADRSIALAAYRKMRAGILFEVIVNRSGQVAKIRIVRSLEDETVSHAFLNQMANSLFEPSRADGPGRYRTFFLPLRTSTAIIER